VKVYLAFYGYSTFFPFNEGFVRIDLMSFNDSVETFLMDFLAIFHYLSYQGLVILLFFL
jgi:hypothetical protein